MKKNIYWKPRKTNWFSKEEEPIIIKGFQITDYKSLKEIETQMRKQAKKNNHTMFHGFPPEGNNTSYQFCSRCNEDVTITAEGEKIFHFDSEFFNKLCPGSTS